VQLARERGVGALAFVHLASGKLPPSRVDLAGGTLREQECAVGALDHGSGDFQHQGRYCAPIFSSCRPQSRANW
jgi:hypothetical protein